ncbi:MATE family efflux transporter [Salipaludibacillus aurantiacus]|uniref:Multidrug export protein MepA n=1 Tax=Salipaludibacillus aurantiacus TaxID=1601833 RepID=A0A1H9WSD2_9BACI|nr:MATE family efflux transporter [Salipaludibacillus aurantiacus]SES36840.1 putative efflux protein, MATE family [Salipaludibacillus aurantiacus]
MSQKEQSTRLGSEPVPKLLKSLSIPAMIGMVVMALYNVVDTIFISYFVGIDGVAAVTIAFPIMIIMMALAAALGIGGSSVISRRLGEKRDQEANRVFSNIISLIIVLSFIGVIASFTVLEPILKIFGATPEIMQYALDYIFPITMATIFFTFSFTTNAIIRSEGNARFAMITMIIPSVLNIILDPVFIIWLNMGVQGAAIATVISQASISIIVLHYFLTGKSSLKIRMSEMIPQLTIIKEVTVIGLPAFVRQVAGSVMMVAINAMLISHGGEFYVGVFGIVQRIAMFALMPMMGILQGMQPIVGYNYGARQFERMRETILLCLKLVTVFSAGVFIAMMAFPAAFMRIFTADPEVIATGVDGIRIMFAAAVLIGVQVVSGGLYQALGKAKPALVLSMARQVLFLIPLVLILPNYFGVWGVWIAFPLADILAFALSIGFMYRDRKLFFKGKDTDGGSGGLKVSEHPVSS